MDTYYAKALGTVKQREPQMLKTGGRHLPEGGSVQGYTKIYAHTRVCVCVRACTRVCARAHMCKGPEAERASGNES